MVAKSTDLTQPRRGSRSAANHGSNLTADEVEFGRACDAEKRRRGVVMLTAGQILAVTRSLGYRRVGQAKE